MAAITTTTIPNAGTDLFRGGRGLTEEAGEYSLVALINLSLVKLREIIGRWNLGTLDLARVGSANMGNYIAGNMSWLDVDGTNPPTFARFRMYDNAGALRTVTINAGVFVIS